MRRSLGEYWLAEVGPPGRRSDKEIRTLPIAVITPVTLSAFWLSDSIVSTRWGQPLGRGPTPGFWPWPGGSEKGEQQQAQWQWPKRKLRGAGQRVI